MLDNLLNMMLEFFSGGEEFSNCCVRIESLIKFVPPFNFEFSKETHRKFVGNTIMLSNSVTPTENPWNLEFSVELYCLDIV